MNGAPCSITGSPFALCNSKPPYKPIQRRSSEARAYRPEWEEGLLVLDRVYQYLAQGRWFRANHRGAIHLGTYEYCFGSRYQTKADLMGDLAWMLALPAYQLAFPFSPEEQRHLALVECLSDTTL
jgi:hypothetical protein